MRMIVGFELPGRMGMLVSFVFAGMLVSVGRGVAAVLVFVLVHVFVIVTMDMRMLVRMLGSAVRMFVGVHVGMFVPMLMGVLVIVGFAHDDLPKVGANKNYCPKI